MQLVGQRRLQVVFQAAAHDRRLGDRLQGALGAEVGAEVGQTGGRAQFEATRDPVDAVAVGTEGAVQNTAGSPGGDGGGELALEGVAARDIINRSQKTKESRNLIFI